MPETPYQQFRLGPLTLADLDALAAGIETPDGRLGNRSQAVREAIAYWRRVVEDAGQQNADDLSKEDWHRLAHLNRPDMPSDSRDDEERSVAIDWSARLAAELVGMWEGRELVLPMHREEAKACRALAKRIGGWGVVRGYALFACLRYFWATPSSGVGGGDWWTPEIWMTPTAKDA
jgi:hypothetical protein